MISNECDAVHSFSCDLDSVGREIEKRVLFRAADEISVSLIVISRLISIYLKLLFCPLYSLKISVNRPACMSGSGLEITVTALLISRAGLEIPFRCLLLPRAALEIT